MNKNHIALAATLALALLCTACSAETPAAVTVTETAPTTIVRSTSVTKTTTSKITTSVTATVTRMPDPGDATACTAVATELGSWGLLEPLQRWSGGGSLTVGDLVGGIQSFSDLKEQGPRLKTAITALNTAGQAFRDAANDDLQDVAGDFTQAWSDISDACIANGTPVPAVQVVTSTVVQTSKVTVGGDGAPATSVANGDYLVPSQIKPGVYQCSAGDNPYWESTDRSGEIIDNGLSTIARVPTEAYSMTLNRCNTDWVKVG